MVERLSSGLSRRRFLLGLAAGIAGVILQACRPGGSGGPVSGNAPQALPPTPACGVDDEADPTAAQTEGPFFTTDSPERNNFRGDVTEGVPLVLAGTVLTTACAPVANALIDVWHADDQGVYDNRGFRLRGHLFSGDDGTYRLETIVPGLYPGRTRHLHVKVQAPGGRVLTTQLYFPDEPANQRDGIFQPELNMVVEDSGEGKTAEFNFVLEA